ncbi:YHYH protein [Pseudanabaena sp. PCC 6802]|uniref:YHYH protein n=1 Tax=Pseudanabaena sp. PCC 6802 TaxID=118173 RepID=UPI00034B7FAD|nr:YHYH protein [Pseudanabaena sp. PCC 6802]
MHKRFIGIVLAVIALVVALHGINFDRLGFVSFATSTQQATGNPQTSKPVLVSQVNGVDLTRLPLGDGKISNSPRAGWIWPCRIDSTAGGAFFNGSWIKADGTYDFTAKAVVDGGVTWPHRFKMSLQGNKRIFTTNDLPNHPTGVYPIAQTDDAFLYDRNPNRIAMQNMQVELPANPQLAAQPTCTPGAVGILETGVVLFNALDAPGRDAVAHEAQDACQGHPQESGVYHYHSATTCLPDRTTKDGHSTLIGYSLDGFGIYGRRGEGGRILASADLDACHGHTHAIAWNGKQVSMYHYHATWDFPYTVGCMRGKYKMGDVMVLSGPPPMRDRPGFPPQNFGNPPPRYPQTGDRPGFPPQNFGNPPPPPRHPDLAIAARKLGISERQLREALGPPPPNLGAAASRLGISERMLRDALGVP